MAESNFLATRPRSPIGLAIVISAHAAILTALALSKMEMPRQMFGPIELIPIREDPVPPENPPEPKEKEQPPQDTVIDRPPPPFKLPPSKDEVPLDRQPDLPVRDSLPTGDGLARQPSQPVERVPAQPVRIEARMDPRSVLQPAYPSSEQRMGTEGHVVVRLLIGADGRVKAVEKIAATSEAFWRATERHALRHWRFRPATLDGQPVESRQKVTVHFRMDS